MSEVTQDSMVERAKAILAGARIVTCVKCGEWQRIHTIGDANYIPCNVERLLCGHVERQYDSIVRFVLGRPMQQVTFPEVLDGWNLVFNEPNSPADVVYCECPVGHMNLLLKNGRMARVPECNCD